MIMKKLLLTIILIFATLVCKANGDPVLWSSALTLSSCPQARHIPEIMLTDEHLEITSYGPTSHIRVTYILTNKSSKTFAGIDYGFPIDWYGSGKPEIKWNDYETESERIYGWNDAYVKDVHFTIDNCSLSWKCSADTILTKATKMEDLLTQEEKELPEKQREDIFEQRLCESYRTLFDICRRWYYTSFDFAPNQQRTLTVEYTIANNYAVNLYTQGRKPQYIIDDPTTYAGKGRAEIAYDFTPSSYWGNGHAGIFNINLLLKNADTDYQYSSICYDWQDKFQAIPDSTCWTFSAKDFDLATAKPLYVSYRFSLRAEEEAQTIE